MREHAAEIGRLDIHSLQQALVTEYDAGVTIGWHRDKPMAEAPRYSVTFRTFVATP